MHTPTPWRLNVTGSYGDQVFNEKGLIVADCKWTASNFEGRCANAAFIVEACNAHDALVARVAELEGALRKIADEQCAHPGFCYHHIARAALAKVKG